MWLILLVGLIAGLITIYKAARPVYARLALARQYAGKIGDEVQGQLPYAALGPAIDCLVTRARQFGPEVIYGIDRGGPIVGNMIAKRLPLDRVYQLKIIDEGGERQAIQLSAPSEAPTKILLVDDASYTGKNMETARKHLANRYPSAEILSCAIVTQRTANPGRRPKDNVDCFAYYTLDGSCLLPWDDPEFC